MLHKNERVIEVRKRSEDYPAFFWWDGGLRVPLLGDHFF